MRLRRPLPLPSAAAPPVPVADPKVPMLLARPLLVLLSCGALVATPVLTPVSAAPHPVAATVQRVDVDLSASSDLSAPGAGAGVLESEPVEADDFSVVGVTWDSEPGVEALTVEVRTDDGSGWGPWTLLPLLDEGPDAGTAEAAGAVAHATSPLWVGSASAVQTRVRPAAAPAAGALAGTEARTEPGGEPGSDSPSELPESLQLALVDPGTSAADGRVQVQPLASADAAAARPTFISRAQWGADESKRNCDPDYNDTVKAAVVHHTAGSNGYSSQAQAMQQLRGDYAYHTEVLGWCDLGYNVVVDRFGNVYEGRAGGVDRAVAGAHAGGFNADTFGISALGNYSTTSAPAAMVDAITRVVAWKLDLHDRDPMGTVVLTSAGGGTARYPAGQDVRVNVVSGHRDVGLTECPGTNLYAKLGAIRSAAAALVGPQEPSLYHLARTQTDPRVWLVNDTQRFPVLDVPTYDALAPLGPVRVVASSELTRRTTGPAFGRFAVGPDSRVWHLDGGGRAYVASCDLVWAYGQRCSSLPGLTAGQVAAFAEHAPLQLFVRSRTDPTVYVMWDGRRRPVATWEDLLAVNRGIAPGITMLEPGAVDAMPLGVRMLAPGTLVKSPTDPRVLLVDSNETTVPLESFSAAAELGTGGLETVDAATLAAYARQPYVLLPTVRCGGGSFVGVDGVLRPADPGPVGQRVWLPLDAASCTALGASGASPGFAGPLFAKGDSSDRIYLLTGDQKRPVTSWTRFGQLGGSTFVPFPDSAIAALPTGPAA